MTSQIAKVVFEASEKINSESKLRERQRTLKEIPSTLFLQSTNRLQLSIVHSTSLLYRTYSASLVTIIHQKWNDLRKWQKIMEKVPSIKFCPDRTLAFLEPQDLFLVTTADNFFYKFSECG